MKRLLSLLLLVCSPAYGQLSFAPVNGVDTGLESIVTAWKTTLPGPWFWGATAIDYDGDGDSDVCFTVHDGVAAGLASTIICRNNFVESGSLTFTDVTATAFPSFAGLPYGNKPHVFDLDNDGDLDLLCGEKGKTFLNTAGVFTSNGQTLRGVERGVVMGDFNSDGLKDYYAVLKSYGRGAKNVYTNGPNGVFTLSIVPVFDDDIPRPATIYTRTDNDTCRLMLNSGHGLVLAQTVNVSWSGGQRTGMAVSFVYTTGVSVNVDGGTGDPLPAANTAVQVETIADPFYESLPPTVRARYEASIAAVNYATGNNRYRGPDYLAQDVNGDGLPDVLIWFEGSYSGDAWFYLCLRQPDGSLVESSAATGLPIDDCRPLSATDVNGDGRADLLLTPGGVAKSGLWIQAANGTFSNAANPGIADYIKASAPYTPHEVWEDFDQDGDPDLAISMLRLGSCKVWENDAGTFTERLTAGHWDADGMQVRSRAGYAVDFNHDGLTDVLTAGTGVHGSTAPITCWINTSAPLPPPPPPGDLIIRVDGQDLPDGSTATIDGVPVPPPTGEADKVIEIETPEPLSLLIPTPTLDTSSANFRRWLASIQPANKGSAWEHALAYRMLGDESHRTRAIDLAAGIVAANTVGGNQYLPANGQFRNVFCTLDWCQPTAEQRAQWLAWGKSHLGRPDGSIEKSLWWSSRYSRNNPANNYFHGFVGATSYYAMAARDAEWIAWLKADRFPLLRAYYATTPEGGSREGTGYGESHRTLLDLAKLWRDFDGTNILPQEFINGSLLYWTHATTPGHGWVALIGDHTRTHGTTDGYHRHLIGAALALADDPDAIAAGRWQLSKLKPSVNAVFFPYELIDHTTAGLPPPTLDYYARGVGHFFSRTSWDADAEYCYCTAGMFDENHQQQDQGAFAVFAAGRWQTCSDSPWTHGGTAQTVDYQNVVRFGVPQKRLRSGTLQWARSGGTVTVDMDLTAPAQRPWKRRITWTGGSPLVVRDWCDPTATFGFCKPSEDDTREPYVSEAAHDSAVLADGFTTTVEW